MIRRILRVALAGLVVVLLQWLFFGRLMLWGTHPDVVLLFVAWAALQYGSLGGSLSGFGAGLLLDAVYGTWGIQMMVKTITGYLVGLLAFQERGALLRFRHQAFLAALVIALVNNGFLVLLLMLQSGARTISLLTEVWLGCALYTAVVAVLISVFVRA